jgi:hypothetical protein
MTTVIINDYVIDRRVNIMLDANDFEIAERVLAVPEPDELLMQLQHLETFQGRTHLSHLEPFHYRVMITMNLKKVAAIRGVSIDLADPAVKSLVFLVACLILCLEKRADSHIELLKLNRVGELDVTVEFSALMSIEDKTPKKKKKGGITVVVDNT